MKTKICSRCKEEKELIFFGISKKTKDGLCYQCKECRRKICSISQQRHKDTKKRWEEKNKEDIKQKKREYFLKNKDKIKAKRKIYIEKNKDKISEKCKEYQRNNKESIKIQKKKYYKENADKIKRYQAERQKERLKTDPLFRSITSLRLRTRLALKTNMKAQNSFRLFGCSSEELRKHLESQFKEGMSWDNYGYYGWHIDHIRPCSSFDLSDPEQQKECFHYTNLQPLWAEENLKKSNKYSGELCMKD